MIFIDSMMNFFFQRSFDPYRPCYYLNNFNDDGSSKDFRVVQFYQDLRYLEIPLYWTREKKKKIKNVWISLSPNAQVNLNNLIDNISRTIMAEAINSFKNSRLERYIFHLPLSLFLA